MVHWFLLGPLSHVTEAVYTLFALCTPEKHTAIFSLHRDSTYIQFLFFFLFSLSPLKFSFFFSFPSAYLLGVALTGHIPAVTQALCPPSVDQIAINGSLGLTWAHFALKEEI